MSSEKNCRWDRSYDHFYTRLPSLPSAPASGCRHGYLKKETRSFTLPGLELNILFYGAGMVSSSSEHPSQTRFTCALILNFVTGHLGAAACRHPQNNTLWSHRNNSWAARQRSWSFCTERGRQSRWGLQVVFNSIFPITDTEVLLTDHNCVPAYGKGFIWHQADTASACLHKGSLRKIFRLAAAKQKTKQSPFISKRSNVLLSGWSQVLCLVVLFLFGVFFFCNPGMWILKRSLILSPYCFFIEHTKWLLITSYHDSTSEQQYDSLKCLVYLSASAEL